jgi:hypothetical protein
MHLIADAADVEDDEILPIAINDAPKFPNHMTLPIIVPPSVFSWP